MRATRAYIAGFGTAGSILAGCAVLFVVASAVVAFRGWPKVASQGAPATLELGAAPASGSRVDRRLHVAAAATAAFVLAPRVRAAARATHAASHGTAAGAPVRGGGGAARPARPTSGRGSGRPGGASGSPAGASAPSGSGSGSSGGGSGNGGITVSVPTNPPITVTVPTPPIKVPVPSAPVSKVLSTVTGSAGHAITQAGADAGSAVGGGAGSTVSGVTGAAGATVAKAGSAVGNLLGG